MTFWALLLAEPSHAHVLVRPELVEAGQVTEVEIELPRSPPADVDYARLELVGEGIEGFAVSRRAVEGDESYWRARVRVTAPAGRAPFVLRAYLADGAAAEFDYAFTVVPPPDAPFPWAVAVAGAAAAGLAGAGLVLARRRGR